MWLRDIKIIPLCHSKLDKDSLPLPLSLKCAISLGSDEDIEKLIADIAHALDCRKPEFDRASFIKEVEKIERKYRGRGQSDLAAGPSYICMLYGDGWPGLTTALQVNGFSIGYIDTVGALEKASRTKGLIVLPGTGYKRERPMLESEASLFADFVAKGGGLLCVGQAWSWAYRAYGNKPVESFPLNKLGTRLGFQITGCPAGKPDSHTLPPTLPCRNTEILQDNWNASEIEIKDHVANRTDLLRDEKGRLIAVELEHGKGKVIVAGSEGLMEQHPEFLKACLNILQPKSA